MPPFGSRLTDAVRSVIRQRQGPQPHFGGEGLDIGAQQEFVTGLRGDFGQALSNPEQFGVQFSEALQPQFESFGRLVRPQFQQDIGTALGGTFAKSGRSGAANVAVDRISRNFADRLGEHRNQLIGQALSLGTQHAGNVLGAFGQQQQNLLGLRQFGFQRDAFQKELALAQEAARQKKKGGFLGAVGGLLGGVGGFLAGGPAGAAAGIKGGSTVLQSFR